MSSDPTVKISALPAVVAANIVETDSVPGVFGGITSKTTVGDVRAKLDLAREFNVKHPAYGAIGNGVANDTAAFASAMTALSVAGGGILRIPAGTYIVDPPALAANCRVKGEGKNATILKAFSVNGSWIGTDVSSVWLDGFTFIGKANNGAATTDHAVFIRAVAQDVTEVRVTNCAFKQFKSLDSCVRIAGNGDLVTPATKFVIRATVTDCTVTEYYDTNPALLAVMSTGIYFFGGVKEIWCQRNYIDGTSGKHGIGAQSEANDAHIEDNIVINCGSANAQFGYGIFVYSSYTTASVVDAFISRNTIIRSSKAGIYLAAIGKYNVSNNILDTCDVYSLGLGTVGFGAISINNNGNNAANGVGVCSDNTILDPGACAIYVAPANFQRSECTVTGNTCKMVTAGLNRTGCVIYGRGVILSDNTFRGFVKGIFLYNSVDDEMGDLTITNNQLDCTGAAGGTLLGLTWNTQVRIGPMVVKGNRFKAYNTGVDLRNVTEINFDGNIFSGCTTCAILNVQGGSVSNNIADGGTSGLILQLLAATAAARITVSGNLFSKCATPCTINEGTGFSIVFGNDFGTQPGVAADQGDASVASGLNNPTQEVFPWTTTLTANRTATLSAVRCFRGDKKTIVRNAAAPGAFTLALVDDLGATIATIPASTKGFATAIFNGTNWKIMASGTYA